MTGNYKIPGNCPILSHVTYVKIQANFSNINYISILQDLAWQLDQGQKQKL
jgi:hypothetical protein